MSVSNLKFVTSRTHKRLKRTLFNWTKQDKTCEFSRKSFLSKLRTTLKKKRKTINSLSLCQFDAGMLAGGKGHCSDF